MQKRLQQKDNSQFDIDANIFFRDDTTIVENFAVVLKEGNVEGATYYILLFHRPKLFIQEALTASRTIHLKLETIQLRGSTSKIRANNIIMSTWRDNIMPTSILKP